MLLYENQFKNLYQPNKITLFLEKKCQLKMQSTPSQVV